MKKTIAILLILVIGMVGVFAADPVKLNLSTEIELINRLAITNASTLTYQFGSGADPASVDFNPANVYVKNFDLVNDAPTTTVANLHYMTNNPNEVTVSFLATPLVNNLNTELFIPYRVQIGDVYAIVNIDSETDVPGTDYIYEADYTTILSESKQIKLVITGTTDNFVEAYAAGTYSATVTFTLTAS